MILGTVQIEERPPWIQCIAYGIQHVLAMFSGVIVLRRYIIYAN
jgi:putative pyrimidine permease RutG